MRRRLAVVLLFLLGTKLWGLEPASDPALATVRIKSHGASATIIATTEGRSWLLGCAHMLTDRAGKPSETARKKPLKIDGPVQPYARKGTFPVRLIAWDYDLDLSLMEIDNGPFNFIPVAGDGFQPSGKLWSCGYDNMSWPITKKPATILMTVGDTTFTKEKPWHGRSGGGLSDGPGRVLIGVVQGYELYPSDRGLYVSHRAIRTFLKKHWPNAPPNVFQPALPKRQRYILEPAPKVYRYPQPLPGC